MADVPADAVLDAALPFDRALAAVEGELGVVFTSGDRVAAACGALRAAAGGWRNAADAGKLLRLVPHLQRRTGPWAAPLFALLREAALATADPWPLLEGLLGCPDETVCAQALGDAAALAATGTLALHDRHLEALAALVEREESPLAGATSLAAIGALLRQPRADALRALLLDPARPAVRRLAARVLDAEDRRPDAHLVRGVLGEPAAAVFAPALEYTRASHLDLVALVRRPAEPGPLATAFPAVIEACSPPLANDIVAEFGWPRVNLGLSVRRVVGVSVDGSLPFLLAPSEAALVMSCPGARRVFDCAVALGHGGTLERAAAGASDTAVTRFRDVNLAHADVLGEILDLAPLTVGRVESILAKLDRLVGEFVALFASQSAECAELPGVYAALRDRVVRDMTGAPPDRPLPLELTRLVQMFEDPASLADVRTLHGLKRYLHQRGLALGFNLLQASQSTNRTVDLALVSWGRVRDPVRRIEYVDFDAPPVPREDGEPLPHAVAIVADAFARHLLHGETALPLVRIFCYGNEVHYFVTFRNHPVFIRIDYSPPFAGGMIDLAYYGVSKFELDAHPDLGLEAIQAIFRRLDFQIEIDNTRIHARYDKERAIGLTDLYEKAEALFRLAPYLMDADWIIGGLDLDASARRAVAEAWADFFVQWGVLPARSVLTGDGRGIVMAREPRPEGDEDIRWTGHGAYTDVLSGRPRRGWLGAIHDAVAAQGLDVPLVEQERDAGQIPLEQHVLRPLRAAVARGAIVEADGGFRRAAPERYREEHEVDRFAELLSSSVEALGEPVRMARLATALERSLRFTTTGSVNGFEVQRAGLALGDAAGALYALRDAAGIFRLAIYAPGGAICRHRRDTASAWIDSVSTDVDALAAALRRRNLLPSWIDSVPSSEELARTRAMLTGPVLQAAVRPVPGERAVAGFRASPGRASGRARLGTRGRQGPDLAGGVLIATTLTPDDSVFLPYAEAVVGTGGGILSHAGLMAVQFGRPALVVPGEWREDTDGTTSLVYRALEFEEHERTVCGWLVTERRDVHEREERLREGDLVTVDADRGVLEVLGQSGAALALEDGLRSLREAARRLASASTPGEVLTARGHRLRALHQLTRLLSRLDDPPLVQHAVRELLAGPLDAVPTVSGAEQGHLLQVLRGNPVAGALVEPCAARTAREIAERYENARARARGLIPTSTQPYEVLALARAVWRLETTLAQVAAFSGARAGGAPADDVQALSRARLEALLEGLLASLRETEGSGVPASRHALGLAARVAHVLASEGVAAGAEALAGLREHAGALAARDAAAVAGLAARRVVWPEDGGLELEPLAGSKAANLGEIARVGAPGLVPPWFVVTDRAFREALASQPPLRPGGPWTAGRQPATLGEAIDMVVARTDAEPSQKAALVEQLWGDVRLPAGLVDEVSAAYARLAQRAGSAGDDLYVAIRSSAREEDIAEAVRAGEFSTFLFVKGATSVVRHLCLAWSGLWTARAIHDRAASGRSGAGEGGGVIVQAIAWSRVSGVLQTTNVAEGRTREMVVNAGLGLGEGVVSGLVAADHIVVSKDEDPRAAPLRFHYVVADKRARVVFDARSGSGTVRTDVLSHQRLRPALEYAELVELVQAATRLEAAYGSPLDLEFGFDETRLYVLQVRPVPGTLAVWQARDAGVAS